MIFESKRPQKGFIALAILLILFTYLIWPAEETPQTPPSESRISSKQAKVPSLHIETEDSRESSTQKQKTALRVLQLGSSSEKSAKQEEQARYSRLPQQKRAKLFAPRESSAQSAAGDEPRAFEPFDQRTQPPSENQREPEPNSRLRPANLGAGPAPQRPSAQATDSEEESSGSPIPSPDASPEPVQLLKGEARGLALLAMMHPLARDVSTALLDSLFRAELEVSVIGVLFDGTFRFDLPYLIDALGKFSTGGRRNILVLYLASGPTMRRSATTPIRTAFSTLSPESFEREVLGRTPVRAAYRALLRQSLQVFRLNKRLNPDNQNILVPVLEDDLANSSFENLSSYIRSELGNNSYELLRNPRLFEEANAQRSTRLEAHEKALFGLLRPGDAWSLDGEGVDLRGGGLDGFVSSSELEALLRQSPGRNLSYVMLWQRSWQGLGTAGQLQHPDEREYRMPSEEELELLTTLLRTGLS